MPNPLAFAAMRMAALLLFVLAGGAGAQRPAWTGTLTTGLEGFVGDGPVPPNWLWEDARVEHKNGRTSLSGEGIVSRRYDQWDQALAAEAYFGTTSNGYANIRVLGTPNAHVLPSSDLYGEIFQGFAKTWEGSLALRRMNFATSGTTIGAVGIARNFANDYVRLRYLDLVGQGTSAGSVLLTARHFGADTDNFIEGGFATGHEVVNIGPNQDYDIRPSTSGYVRGQRYATTRLGFGGVASLAKQSGIPNRLGGYLSAMVRW